MCCSHLFGKKGNFNKNIKYIIVAFSVICPISFAANASEDGSSESSLSTQAPVETEQKNPAPQEEYFFNTSFLRVANPDSVDLNQLFKSNGVLPGSYYATIFVNETELYSDNIQIKLRDDDTSYVCLNNKLVKAIRFNEDTIPGALKAKILQNKESDDCLDLESLLPESSVKFNSNDTSLKISIPQLYHQKLARGAVDESLWDSGITAGILNYSLSAYNSEANGESNQSAYASLNTGINIGSWYFRQNGNLTWSEDDGAEYTSLSAYVQRDVAPIKGRITIGQSNTQGQLFNSVPFTGIQLSSDDRMLPSSQRGYAPQIYGVARTTAKVSVYQADMLIYETTVSPGEFLINDLYPTGYGGNLNVKVRETDGSEREFIVPYESMAQLIRPGFHRYSLTAGLYRNEALLEMPTLLEGTYQRGLTNSLTAYSGVQGNEYYQAGQVGLAVGTFLGAISADITYSKTTLQGEYEEKQGQSYQIRYSKNFTDTGSNLSLASFRHASEDYLDYRSAMQARDHIAQGKELYDVTGVKDRYLVTANQNLPDGWGQFYGSASIENYWNQEGYSKQYQLGYNNSFGSLSWGFMVSRMESAYGTETTNYTMNASIPLGTSNYTKRPQLRITLNQDDTGLSRQQTTISGTLGENNEFNYSAGVSSIDYNDSVSTDVNLGYSGSLATVSASYSAGDDYHSETFGITGSALVHSGGVTLSPYVGNTYAIVEAKGAEGAQVSGYPGIEIDSNGYAVLPYLSPYQINEVYVDSVTSDKDVELLTSSDRVVPLDKAVVLVQFKAKQGQSILINTTLNGEPIQFGLTVEDAQGNMVGSVGQGGQIYARVEETSSTLTVSWGSYDYQKCTIDYEIDEDDHSKKMQQIDAECNLLAPEPALIEESETEL